MPPSPPSLLYLRYTHVRIGALHHDAGQPAFVLVNELGRPVRSPMTVHERANLVLAFGKSLYANGQATEQMVDAAKRLGRALGLRATIIPRWGELQLVADSEDAALAVQSVAAPAGVEMDRVASTMRAIEDIAVGRLAPEAAKKTIDEISRSPPSPTGLFALAAAAGAVALAVIFGVEHIWAAILIFVSAGAGAVVRRALNRLSANLFLQPFCAAGLAGVTGAVAVRWDLSSSLRLVAICPCMVLVPGPHFLNGALGSHQRQGRARRRPIDLCRTDLYRDLRGV